MSDLIIDPQDSGMSDWIKVHDRWGKFVWDVPPQLNPNVGSGESPMYLFQDENGETWWVRLEKDKQGGRWEKAHHAELEYYQMHKNPEKIKQMWGEPDEKNPLGRVGRILTEGVKSGKSWNQILPELSNPNVDTWRQISGDVPSPAQDPYNTSAAQGNDMFAQLIEILGSLRGFNLPGMKFRI